MRHLQKRLYYKAPSLIAFDRGNPRGETEEQITSDPEFKKLVNSIKDFGVLEPLIVRKKKSGKKEFVLVDGERRLWAATKAKEPEIPVLIANNEADGRILAYQVHKLRKDWTPSAETKSIKSIIADIKDDNPDISDADLKRQLSEITNMKPHSLNDILRLIKYDDYIINQVIADKNKGHSYLVQIEQSFVNKVKRFYPDILSIYDENTIRHILAEKAFNGKLGGTSRYLMDTFKDVFNDKDKKSEIQKLLLNFLKNKNQKIEIVFAKYQKLYEPKEEKTTTQKKAKKKTTKKTKKKCKAKGTSVPKVIDHRTKLKVIEADLIRDNVFDILFNYLKEAIVDYEKRVGIQFKNEPDLQKYVYSVLRCLFQ